MIKDIEGMSVTRYKRRDIDSICCWTCVCGACGLFSTERCIYGGEPCDDCGNECVSDCTAFIEGT